MTDLSEGGSVKEKNIVIQRRLKDHPDLRFNINCRAATLGLVMGQFDETKRKWVADMGMERLFSLVDRGLPRNLCYWIATRVDVPKKTLVACDKKEYPLSYIQVHWVLGILAGPKEVPNKTMNDDMKREEHSIWEKYNTTSPKGTEGIARSMLLKVVESEDVDELEFKRDFLMMALNDVLCPTTCHCLSPALLPAVADSQ